MTVLDIRNHKLQTYDNLVILTLHLLQFSVVLLLNTSRSRQNPDSLGALWPFGAPLNVPSLITLRIYTVR